MGNKKNSDHLKETGDINSGEDVADEKHKGKSSPKVDLNLDNLEDILKLLIGLDNANKDVSDVKYLIIEHIENIIDKYSIDDEYLLLFLYDIHDSISQETADKIYDAIPEDNDKPILLIIHSSGGRVEPAYLISKTCKEHSPKFIVSIPRKAKSAATLIALGGDEIHMGSMSELGPIDPQFGGLPALGLNSALNSIAKVVSEYPKSGNMFSSFLEAKLDLRILGYFERVSESAKQYAIRLLEGKDTPKAADEIAHVFVYEYKDHNFVVDKDETATLLGESVIVNSDEYKFSNEIHRFLSRLNLWGTYLGFKRTGVVGSYEDIVYHKRESDN